MWLGQSLEYLVIYGPTPREILRKYTGLTGRPALPPPWSFGLWLSTSFTTSYDEQTVTGFVDGMATRDLPLSVFHFDCFWMREFQWCDFTWDNRTFPDPSGMLSRLKDKGLRICVWINPYIAQRSPLFAEAAEHNYLVRKPDGDVWQTDKWQAGMGIVDFTNPDARQWYTGKLRALLDMGVDCFKTDFGERIPTDVVWFDGADPERMHNFYSYLYNQTVFELLRTHRGEQEAVVFARSATAGGQRFPVHWGGDCESTFVSMAESLRGGLSLAMSGFGFWSHDIGGFEGRPDPAVFKRWIPFGLLCTHSRLHGSDSYRVPWLFDEESVEVLRRFTRLKAQLMPYIYGQAWRRPEMACRCYGRWRQSFPTTRPAPTWIGSTCSGIGCWWRRCSRHPVRPLTTSRPARGRTCRPARPYAGPPGSTRCATSRQYRSSCALHRCFRSVRATTGRTIRTTRTSRCGRTSSPTAVRPQ